MPSTCAHPGFRHEALFYEGALDGFVDGVAPLVADTLDAGGRAAVAAPADRVERLSALFGPDDRVELINMTVLGVNPARIIPAWRDLTDRALARGGPFLGVGEPVWAGRTNAEIDECHRHEALINVAFADDPSWRLVCPYDVDGLGAAVVEDARRTHPAASGPDGRRSVADIDGIAAFNALERPLSPVPPDAATMRFERRDLATIRELATRFAATAVLTTDRTQQLLLAVTELTANSVRHGGGAGTLSIWQRGRTVFAQSQDRGRITDPMVGRRRPSLDGASGRGLWIMHQLCDLVQVRTSAQGTVVRLTHR